MSIPLRIDTFKTSITDENITLFMQRCYPGWEDLRHRRHREQRRSSPRQHGDLRPLHQHLDSPAVTALPALQTRLCCHQKVHSELLRVANHNGSTANTSWAPGCGTMGDGSLGLGQSVSDLRTWRQHPSTPLLVQPPPPPQKKKKKALCRMYSCSTTRPCQLMMPNLQYWLCHGCSSSSNRHRDPLSKTPWLFDDVINFFQFCLLQISVNSPPPYFFNDSAQLKTIASLDFCSFSRVLFDRCTFHGHLIENGFFLMYECSSVVTSTGQEEKWRKGSFFSLHCECGFLRQISTDFELHITQFFYWLAKHKKTPIKSVSVSF